VKEINDRYKLAGNFCVKVEYHFDDGVKIKFPVDPDLLYKHFEDVPGSDSSDNHFAFKYVTVLDAYTNTKVYIEKLRSRVTILRDD
jgi:hypothetical protein